MGMVMGMAIAIGIMAVVIPIRTAATADAVLQAADSVAAVRERCRQCLVRAPIGGGVVINNDAIVADAPKASPLLPSGAMDPTEAAMTKTHNGNDNGSNGDGNGNSGDGGDGDGDGNSNSNGDDNSNGDGGGGVQWM